MNIELQSKKTLARRALTWVAGTFLFCSLTTGAQPDSNKSENSYDSFSIISQRNIFDPNRRGIEPPHPYNRTRATDAFALVGTMSYAKGKFAFFDGTQSDYKKVLEPGASIAGYTVKDITTKDVTLAANGKDIEMKIGTQMRKEGPNGWQLSTQEDLPTSSDSNTAPATDQSLPGGLNPAQTDVLKRLMEQRQQMMSK